MVSARRVPTPVVSVRSGAVPASRKTLPTGRLPSPPPLMDRLSPTMPMDINAPLSALRFVSTDFHSNAETTRSSVQKLQAGMQVCHLILGATPFQILPSTFDALWASLSRLAPPLWFTTLSALQLWMRRASSIVAPRSHSTPASTRAKRGTRHAAATTLVAAMKRAMPTAPNTRWLSAADSRCGAPSAARWSTGWRHARERVRPSASFSYPATDAAAGAMSIIWPRAVTRGLLAPEAELGEGRTQIVAGDSSGTVDSSETVGCTRLANDRSGLVARRSLRASRRILLRG